MVHGFGEKAHTCEDYMCFSLTRISNVNAYNTCHISSSVRKAIQWPLRNVSTQIRLIRADTFRLKGIEVYRVMNPETEKTQKAELSARVSLRGMLRMIRVDNLRGVHTIGFLAGRLIYVCLMILTDFNLFYMYHGCV